MNTKEVIKRALGLGSLLALAATVAGCASSKSQSNVRVTEEKQYIPLYHLQDTSQPVKLKKGDVVAMVCSQCRTVLYRDVNSPATLFFPPIRSGITGPSSWQPPRDYQDWSWQHYCLGCKSTITTTGAWFDRKETIKHTCNACGDKSVFCCATRKSAPATEGMTK